VTNEIYDTSWILPHVLLGEKKRQARATENVADETTGLAVGFEGVDP
jgi:hypothetical protein